MPAMPTDRVAAVGPTLAQAQADDPGAYALDVPIAAASGDRSGAFWIR